MKSEKIPHIIISRLPIYLRTLQQLQAQGVQTISSKALGEILGITAAQIRKDISQFGEFGKQGTGYNVSFLIEQLKAILYQNRVWDVAVIGVGGLGHALAHYTGFMNRGFRVAALFDNDPTKIGTIVNKLPIEDVKTLPQRIPALGIRIAMLTTPASVAQEVTNLLIESGIEGILNYAPTHLIVPDNIYVEHIDPAIGLQLITYYLRQAPSQG
jgi:redox-sensing transcriptional repressor